jgi:hypothetical protein
VPDARADVIAAVAAAWDAGCPMAGQTPKEFEEAADVAIRRWGSVTRRHRKPLTHEQRVEDLAKGLRDRLDPNPELVGREMAEYRYLARCIAAVLPPDA